MTASTPGQAAFAAYYERQAGAALSMPDSWDMQSEGTRADWDAVAQASLDARAAEWTHDPLLDVPPGELAHLLRLVDVDSAGQSAYDGYRSASAARSLVSGRPLPEWGGQSEAIRYAWEAAAEGVIALLADSLASAAASSQDAES